MFGKKQSKRDRKATKKQQRKSDYGLYDLVVDLALVFLTGGLWLIRIILR